MAATTPGRGSRPADGRGRARTLAEVVNGATQVTVTLLGAPVLRRRYNRWGASPDEVTAPLPGDELVPDPQLGYTRAVTIAAPPASVWPWLAQIGQGRGGLYSFDALENLVGCDIESVTTILREHQDLAVEDVVRMGPDGYPCFRVVEVAPPTTLVLVGAEPRTRELPPLPAPDDRSATAATWQWHLRATGDGGTRLLVRQRLTYPRRQWVVWHLAEPVSFVMERRMLRTVRRLAEGAQAGDDTEVPR